ncbi:GNAT family N-acetyltransferase [Aquimarina sp. RZ0]|uniref:GNAT family N-acetyltransferase n=1 Tax=Aquimarina sp. RZ0 TaxID=2607730 RepID=UPI0011F29992|nr:GNAT family N-acetyltransferase [Aquimarina sp. RZ0]KAA1247732.1 N-acetyltransferase family protein [Aquimarina sp. RZ0]
MNIEIQNFDPSDWAAIRQIYQEGIETGMATFETRIPTWDQWNRSHLISCRLKATVKKTLIGWAALAPVSTRDVYRGVAEVSIYITSKYRNSGIGKLLLTKLIEESEKEGLWTLQAGIFSTNIASINLHKSVGFREIGFREKIGKLNNTWYDNTILERRSNIII